jgi:nucleoid DNA-binding protein
MSQTKQILNQLTKNFFRKIFLPQGYSETDFYIQGEIYNPECQYFCFKDDLETGQTICFINFYLDYYSGYEWHVEKFCLCDGNVLNAGISGIFMEKIVQDEYGEFKFSAIRIPVSYTIRTQSEKPEVIYQELLGLSYILGDRPSYLNILVKNPWLKEIRDLINCLFETYHIYQFFYIAPVNNVLKIIEDSVKSRNEVTEYHGFGNTEIEDISNRDVQNIRANKSIGGQSLHNFVNLYLNPFNPMMFVLKKQQKKPVILGISTLVSVCENTYISDGNAASARTKIFKIFEGLDKVEWSTIFSKSWNDKLDGKRIRCAEVLIPESIPANYIENIYFKSNIAKDEFLNDLRQYILTILSIKSEYTVFNTLILPMFSYYGGISDKYIHVTNQKDADKFIEIVNSISYVRPKLFG